MTQVNLERKPFAKHTFYNGVYTHNNTEYSFILTVEESDNNIKPNITLEFYTEYKEPLPFDYGKAYKEILAIYLPDNKNNENNN